MDVDVFKALLAQKGQELYRDMPWRRDTRPYYILVSELMLQQTQVDRVIPKFEAFVSAFPDERTLSQAHLSEVLTLWQGLGYNRRAKYLFNAATEVVSNFDGVIPDRVQDLLSLNGVGKNTAGAIMTYAFNQPIPFIETNVRTVYFHHFFNPIDSVSDAEILPLLEQTIDQNNPRQFYWALMDYGSWLKKQGLKNVGQSLHYKKQSKLDGSVRQIRGQIIKALAAGELPSIDLERAVTFDERFDVALSDLVKEGMVEYESGKVRLAT